LQLEVGNAGGSAMHLSEASAATLLNDGLSFAAHDNITVDFSGSAGHGTHLHNSLSDLEKLHINTVTVATATGDGNVLVNLGAIDSSDLISTLNSSLPNFAHSSDITVALDLLNDTSNTQILSSLAGSTQLSDISLNLQAHGINEFHDTSLLGLSAGSDWLDLSNIGIIHDHGGMNFQVGLAGNDNLSSLDVQLSNETNLSASLQHDLSNFTSPDNYGSLISALQGSGVHDFLIESGKVEITDHLTSALVDSGMLHALPGADVVIDASHEVATSTPGGLPVDSYVHLSTNLNTMAQLGVDQVQVGDAKQVYLDIQNLGLPTGDHTAMDEIRALLNSLDPSNDAKLVAGDYVQSVSLVMSTDLLHTIANGGGFNQADLNHLTNMGVTDIAVRDTSVDHATSAAQASAEAALFGTTNNNLDPAHPPVEVKIIGQADPMHDVLDPTKLIHK